MLLTLDAINAMSRADFTAALGDIFEHAPWVAESAWNVRPFDTVKELHQSMFNALRGRGPMDRIAFLNGHPDLGGALARARAMTAESNAEQGGLGLDRLDDARFARFEAMNADYRHRFGIPFILCVRRHTRASVLRQFARRLKSPLAVERDAAFQEVFHITRLRVADRVSGPGMPAVNGRLSTQVLDTTTSQPAPGIPVSLLEIDDGVALPVTETITSTNAETLLVGDTPLRIGDYELRFDMHAHFAGLPKPGFATIPVRFAISEPEGQCHLSLAISRDGYQVSRQG